MSLSLSHSLARHVYHIDIIYRMCFRVIYMVKPMVRRNKNPQFYAMEVVGIFTIPK